MFIFTFHIQHFKFFINPFSVNVQLLYPLNSSENYCFLDVSRRYKIKHLPETSFGRIEVDENKRPFSVNIGVYNIHSLITEDSFLGKTF